MTQLIVALDGPKPLDMMLKLAYSDPSFRQRWFKIGPQTLAFGGGWDWGQILSRTNVFRIFLDLKLNDTADTVRESVRRFADAGIAAVSTYGVKAAAAALEGAQDTPLKVWQWLWPTDELVPLYSLVWHEAAHGYIVPAPLVGGTPIDRDLIVPGVRFPEHSSDGHVFALNPSGAREFGVTYAVVGRPIYDAPDPIAAARRYAEALG